MPKENAPGSNSFIGAFYASCWDTVQSDMVQAVQQLAQLRGKTLTSSTQLILRFFRKKKWRNASMITAHQPSPQHCKNYLENSGQ
jgi:hypothetical protein